MTSRIMRRPTLGRLRLATVEDASFIMDLINESMAMNFRIDTMNDIIHLIENGVLSICQLDISDAVVGFIALRDYPLMPSLHPGAWEDYIWTKFKAVELQSRNTLFIHLLCFNSIYGRELVESLLKSVYMHDHYVNHIAMVKSLPKYSNLVPGQSRLEASFRRLTILERGTAAECLPVLCVADRSEVCPRLRVRRAVEEDNDDIIPIVQRHSGRLTELYGEFYVSELVARHPESERVLLVCEHKELAVGVICLNTMINYESLEENYDLSPFAGLRKMKQPLQSSSKQNDSTISLSMHGTNNHQAGESPHNVNLKDDAKNKLTRSYENEEEPFSAPRSTTRATQATPEPLDFWPLLDDDEFEFDIVNIDTDLLKVPLYLNYDTYEFGTVDSIMKVFDKKKHSEEKFKTLLPIRKSKMAQPQSRFPEPIRYHGPPNAFVIEMFAVHPDYDERYGFDILETCFELFPTRDYCIMCLPSNHASFPLLEHFTLVTPYSQKFKFINDTLYITHVNSVRGKLTVRPAELFDMDAFVGILENASCGDDLMELFEAATTTDSLVSYVMLCEDQPVGMMILGPLEEASSVRNQYDLEPEPRRPGTDGFVLSSIMSPIIEPHYRWFMREVLRFSKYTTLFWLCRSFNKEDNASSSRHLMSLSSHMVPVHPRSSLPNISGNRDLDKLFKDCSTPYSLWVLEKPITSLPKVYVNNSIVVVGASRTGLSLIETLLLGPTSQYLTFTNITLVSQHGLPTVTEGLKAAITCVPSDGRYNDRYLKRVPFYYYIDIITALMVGIDRKKKCIYFSNGTVKYYDHLVLTCGQQFQQPDYLKESLEIVKEVERGKPCTRMLMDNPQYQPDRVPLLPDLPENVMIINSLYDANKYLRKILMMINDIKDKQCTLSSENQILVYGSCIETYSCIAALLEIGVSAENIGFIEPFPPEDQTKLRVNCFNDELVDMRVQDRLKDLGITTYRKYYLQSWNQSKNHVVSINLMSQLRYRTLPCFALFYYGFKAIDIHAFKAINECGLVYDGGLVVGQSFETNDPSVFGAGTCAKYSRALYANNFVHSNYCSEDVGEALGRMFLMKLDPFVMGDPSRTDDLADLGPRYSESLLAFSGEHGNLQSATRITGPRRWSPVLRFSSPVWWSATLPGVLLALRVRPPGPDKPAELGHWLPHQGHTLITNKNGRYFRLQLNAVHCVQSVTCLSDKEFSPEILVQLYGKHEAFFNKLLARFKMGQIQDLFEFFTAPWMMAIYQESFSGLMNDINNQDVGTVFDMVKSRFAIDTMGKRSETGHIRFETSRPELYGPRDACNQGTIRSVLDKFVFSRKNNVKSSGGSKSHDIPEECGQTALIRNESKAFWNSIGGEKIVIAHLMRYLSRNSLTNPHYAVIDPEFRPGRNEEGLND